MSFDVVVLGEVLIELAGTAPFRDGGALQLGFSGDALNAAGAAAAAGAHVALLTRIAEDEIGELMVARIAALGIDTALVGRVPGENGAYFVHADPAGERSFVYARRGSVGAQLSVADVRNAQLADAGVVLASGVTGALSTSAAEAVLAAAESAQRFVYDPNFRPRLTSAVAAGALLERLAPHAALVTPSSPGESGALLGLTEPAAVAARCRELGAAAVAVTGGADGVWLADGAGGADGAGAIEHLPVVPAAHIVDQTGAGDVFVGTVVARLALGDDLRAAARLGMAASSLSLAGIGGTGAVPTLGATRAHLAAATPA